MPRPGDASTDLPKLQHLSFSGRVEALRGSVDLLIVTATEVERDAVLRRLHPLRARRAIFQGTVGPATYYLGSLGDHGAVLTMCRMGTAGIGASRGAVAAAAVDLMVEALSDRGSLDGLARPQGGPEREDAGKAPAIRGGERGVIVNGDVRDSTIVTGSGNRVRGRR